MNPILDLPRYIEQEELFFDNFMDGSLAGNPDGAPESPLCTSFRRFARALQPAPTARTPSQSVQLHESKKLTSDLVDMDIVK
jgi:hypothetical protein